MIKQQDGICRWIYELNMYRNPTVLTTLAGAAAGNPTVMGSGILAGSRALLYSDFASVKKITAVKERNVIYLDSLFNHNQVYVEDADFDEVYNFIAARCVNASGRAR